jgi:SAM-dependent methyltransferase
MGEPVGQQYDADYFERGIATGKSCYTDYRWISELTIPMAMTIIDYLGIRRGELVLDFGCSKGFLVKAMRMLHRDCWGVDVSEYAISYADPEVRYFCRLTNGTCNYDNLFPVKRFSYCVAKDVFEHVPKEVLPNVLRAIPSDVLFAVIPLGDNGRYRIPAYEMDVTHIIREPEAWWKRVFKNSGWNVRKMEHLVPGIKDNWARYPTGNGFFVLERKGVAHE